MTTNDAPAPPTSPAPLTCWVVSDGRIGIENQALGLAEAVGRRRPLALVRRTAPRLGVLASVAFRLAPSLFARWRIGASNATSEASSVSGPASASGTPSDDAPDLWIGCGRAALAQAWVDRLRFGARTRFVYVQDPKGADAPFDLIIAPEHDGLARETAFSMIGAPNRITAHALEAAWEQAPAPLRARIEALGSPKTAVLLGGDSKRHALPPETVADLLAKLRHVRDTGAGLMITTSRRTPLAAVEAVQAWAREDEGVIAWTGNHDGPNPYWPFLHAAEAVIVTKDSTNMITDAASAGKPVLLAEVAGQDGKLAQLHQRLMGSGHVRAFDGVVEPWPITPLRETERAAEAVLALLQPHNA